MRLGEAQLVQTQVSKQTLLLKRETNGKQMLTLPKKSEMILVNSTDEGFVIATRSEFSWIYLLTMVALVAAFVGMEILDKPVIQAGGVLFAIVMFVTFFIFTAFQSTYQWLRVADGKIDYQLRLWSLPLTRKWALLSEVTYLGTETEASYYTRAIIMTKHWQVSIGAKDIDGGAVYALIDEIKRLGLAVGQNTKVFV